MINTIVKADELRQQILDVAIKNKAGHIAPSLSCLDILTVLHYKIADHKDTIYYQKAMDVMAFMLYGQTLGCLLKKDGKSLICPAAWMAMDL